VNHRNDIRIRPYRIEDAEALGAAVIESSAQLVTWMPWCHANYSIADARAWIEVQVAARELGTAFEFVITSGDGGYLGAVGLNQIDTVNRRANLGYWVRSSATRKGVATRGVQLIRDWAFQNTDLVRLEIVIAAGNVASHRVAEKSGALREGVLKKRLMLYGTSRDATIFSITRDVTA
jgi:RimJ/RimL family protein N-acetyltransferase